MHFNSTTRLMLVALLFLVVSGGALASFLLTNPDAQIARWRSSGKFPPPIGEVVTPLVDGKTFQEDRPSAWSIAINEANPDENTREIWFYRGFDNGSGFECRWRKFIVYWHLDNCTQNGST